jgi:DNA-directed RNA polymerase specialized sigma24 family protein
VTFEEYVAERGKALLRLAYVLVRDRQLAEDMTQTALAHAYRRWRRVESAGQPDAYVRRILVNTFLDARRRRSSTEVPIEVSAQLPMIRLTTSLSGTGSGGCWTLSRRGREPCRRLVLRYYADMDDASIADLLGVSVSGVRATAARALQVLGDGRAQDAVEEAR